MASDGGSAATQTASPWSRYHKQHELGRGRSSIAYKARRARTLDFVVLKEVDGNDARARSLSQREVSVLGRLGAHPNIISLFGWYQTTARVWVVVEYCAGGSLRSLVSLDGALPSHTLIRLARDLIEGLQHIHARRCALVDMRPSNLLLNECSVLKFADFKYARIHDQVSNEDRMFVEDGKSTELGKVRSAMAAYVAPELLSSGSSAKHPRFDPRIGDIWSVGCILAEMATGRPAFSGDGKRMLQAQRQGKADIRPHDKGATPALRDLIALCLTLEPCNRASWAQICSHPFWDEEPHVRPRLEAPPSPAPSKPLSRPSGDYVKYDKRRDSQTTDHERDEGLNVNGASGIDRDVDEEEEEALTLIPSNTGSAPISLGDPDMILLVHASDWAQVPASLIDNVAVESTIDPNSMARVPLDAIEVLNQLENAVDGVNFDVFRLIESEIVPRLKGNSGSALISRLQRVIGLQKRKNVVEACLRSGKLVSALMELLESRTLQPVRRAQSATMLARLAAASRVFSECSKNESGPLNEDILGRVQSIVQQVSGNVHKLLRKRALAALSELLLVNNMYMLHQLRDLMMLLVDLMRPGEDLATHHYAAQILLNIAVLRTDCDWIDPGAASALMTSLLDVVVRRRDAGTAGPLRLTCAKAAHALVVRMGADRAALALRRIRGGVLAAALRDPWSSTQSAILSLVSASLYYASFPTARGLARGLLAEPQGALFEAITSVLRQGDSDVVRGKALLCCSFMIRLGQSRELLKLHDLSSTIDHLVSTSTDDQSEDGAVTDGQKSPYDRDMYPIMCAERFRATLHDAFIASLDIVRDPNASADIIDIASLLKLYVDPPALFRAKLFTVHMINVIAAAWRSIEACRADSNGTHKLDSRLEATRNELFSVIETFALRFNDADFQLSLTSQLFPALLESLEIAKIGNEDESISDDEHLIEMQCEVLRLFGLMYFPLLSSIGENPIPETTRTLMVEQVLPRAIRLLGSPWSPLIHRAIALLCCTIDNDPSLLNEPAAAAAAHQVIMSLASFLSANNATCLNAVRLLRAVFRAQFDDEFEDDSASTQVTNLLEQVVEEGIVDTLAVVLVDSYRITHEKTIEAILQIVTMLARFENAYQFLQPMCELAILEAILVSIPSITENGELLVLSTVAFDSLIAVMPSQSASLFIASDSCIAALAGALRCQDEESVSVLLDSLRRIPAASLKECTALCQMLPDFSRDARSSVAETAKIVITHIE